MRVLSQVEVENGMVDDLAALEDATTEYREILGREARLEAALKVKKARLYRGSTGTVRDRESYVDIESAKEELDCLNAKADTKAQRALLDYLRVRIDTMRSLNSNIRSQV